MEEKNLEQPQAQLEAQPETDSEEKKVQDKAKLEGSIPNKFKSTESLVEAYNNLQKEFTRKSQKLSEVSRELDELKDNNEGKKAPKLPFYEEEGYEKMVQSFFESNPSAKPYASEISEVLLKDNEVVNSTKPLKTAFAKVLANKFLNLEKEFEKDKNLLERVVNNKAIKNSIIESYLASLTKQKTTPVISTHNGTSLSLTPKSKPTTLEEAKNLAEALFKI